MTGNTEVFILSAQRTPIGAFQGILSQLSCTTLGGTAIKAAYESAKITPQSVNQVLMGCVLSAGLGQAPARQACLHAGLLPSTTCTTINKMCGSGMQTVIQAHDSLKANPEQVIVCGGMENMSQAPYLLKKARAGYRIGHQCVSDHMMLDGLEDAYDKGRPMGYFAEQCVKEYQFTREQQDQFATQSLQRALKAAQNNWFKHEICSVTTNKEHSVTQDEGPQKARPDKIPTLRPVFSATGTITAASASFISDGAAALTLCSGSKLKELNNCKPLARIVAHHSHAQLPAEFTTAPIEAIKGVIKKAHWDLDDVDLFEINEAFAVVTMAAIRSLNLPSEKVNPHGGACSLGHPIGASGARIIVTLTHALREHGLKKGVAALCIGGGEATAIAIEII
jgi:acetyl-CoA C-acetyltransferase